VCVVLLPGNLHFVNVVRRDNMNNATYACVAQNRVMRGIQRGEYNKIFPTGGTGTSMISSFFDRLQLMFDNTVMSGNVIVCTSKGKVM